MNKKITVRLASESDKEKWDAYVAGHPEASPYHLFSWGGVIKKAYGFETFFLVAEDDRQFLGILPLSFLKIPFTAGSLVAMPYCDVGSVLANRTDIQNLLIGEAILLGRKHKVKTVELRGNLTNGNAPTVDFPVQTTANKVRMLLSLPGSSENLWQSFKSKLRSQVRKAEKNELTFQWGNKNINQFYTVFSKNMRDLGSPVHSKTWFEKIIEEFQDSAKVGIVYKQNTPVGGGIILRAGNKISIPWASTLSEYNRLNPNMLLYWKFLEHAADSGAVFFDFGRSTPQAGTYKFKAQWGATPEPLPWHHIFLKGHSPASVSEPSKSRARLAGVWQKMPLGVTNYLGPKVRKYISL